MKFTLEVLKNRLVDRVETARASAAPSGLPASREPVPPAAAEVPSASAGDSAGSPFVAGQYPEAMPAADWAVALAEVTENLRSLASSVEHLSRRCDFMIECFRRWQSDLHVDLVYQRMKMTEIESGFVNRIAAAESLLSGKLDAVAGEIRIRQEGMEVALEAHAGAGNMAAAGDLLLNKLDAVAADIRVRQEGMEAALEARAGSGQAAVESLLSGKLETLAAEMAAGHNAIQVNLGRPVLAGRDVLVMKVDDFILAVPRTDWILAAYYVFWGTLERGVTRYLKTVLRPGMVFVDVGANIGIHTLHAARAVGSAGMVHSFEPSPETFRVLEANARANGFEHVGLYPLAVLDQSGEARLHQVVGMCGWNSLFAPADSTGSVPVKATTLDEALAHAGHIDVVKIDAEGAEPFIWRGMRRILAENPRIRIVIEFAPIHLRRAGVRPEDFLADISAAGFAVSRIEDESGDLAPFDPGMLTPTAGANLLLERPAA